MTDVIIGLEVHIELNTQSKLFCPCPTFGDERPNARTCEICMGHPGAKPVVNKSAVEKAMLLALATHCTLAPQLLFSRKSYFYPDMAKNYQITQYEEPLGARGAVRIEDRNIGIERVHLEEDPAAMQHLPTCSLIDYNRSGNPLVELVTKPELHSPEEAREFMKRLRTILLYLDIFDPDYCIIKADANVSIAGTDFQRVEIKNITGFKEIERALFYEVDRQWQIAKEGRQVVQETRGWSADRGYTYPMRLKETEADYGYIMDPDLVPVTLAHAWTEKLREHIPELAYEKTDRFTRLGVDPADAQVLAEHKDVAALFDKVREHVDAPLAAKWIRREVMKVLNFTKRSLADTFLTPERLVDILDMMRQQEITERTAQKLTEELGIQESDPRARVEELGLRMIRDEDQLRRLCRETLEEQTKAVAQLKAGDKKPFHFLLGQVMRKTKGKADPAVVRKVLEESLQE